MANNSFAEKEEPPEDGAALPFAHLFVLFPRK